MLPLTRVLAPLITNRIPLPPCSYTVLPSSVTVRPEPELIVTAIPLPPPYRKTLSLMDIAPDPSLLFTEIPQLPYSTTACDSATVPRPVTRIPPQSPDDGLSLLDVKVISEPTPPATTRLPSTNNSVVPWNRTVVSGSIVRLSPSGTLTSPVTSTSPSQVSSPLNEPDVVIACSELGVPISSTRQ
jgi:hypothetical protein